MRASVRSGLAAWRRPTGASTAASSTSRREAPKSCWRTAVPEKQAVTLVIEPLGEFVGVVGWRRDSYLGIQVLEHRAIRPAAPEPAERAVTGVSSPDHLPLADADAKSQSAAAAPDISVERRPTENPLDLLNDARTIRTLQPGEVLFKEGDSAQSLYIVKSGALRIKSGNVVYEDVQTGGIVGEMGLVEQHMPRSATVFALTAAEVVEIDERRFFSLVERIPSFAIAVMRVLSRRLRHMDDLYRPERWTGLHR